MEIIPFGVLSEPDANGRRHVDVVSMQSSSLEVSILTLGATLQSIEAPDRYGRRDHVSLHLSTADDYLRAATTSYLGATCGRWAGRIADATYGLDGKKIRVDANEGDHHLHGGTRGFSSRIWEIASTQSDDDGGVVVLALNSPHGDQGHPGNVDVTATFELHGHALSISYEATTDAPTACNITNHSYWNLAGSGAGEIEGSIGDHELRVAADVVLRNDYRNIPSGPLRPVQSTPFDLRDPRPLDQVLVDTGGLDLAYKVRPDEELGAPDGLHIAAELHHPGSGRTLTLATDQPALQVYSSERLGPPFQRRSAVCLEAQRFPNSPNRQDLGPSILRPGEHFLATTHLTFGVR